MDIFEYDKREGIPLLCGVDEAGRGLLRATFMRRLLFCLRTALSRGLTIQKS